MRGLNVGTLAKGLGRCRGPHPCRRVPTKMELRMPAMHGRVHGPSKLPLAQMWKPSMPRSQPSAPAVASGPGN